MLILHRPLLNVSPRPHPAPRPEHRRDALPPPPDRAADEQLLRSIDCRISACETKLRRIGGRDD